ncbi:MAG: S9 family peptidase [Acidobacteriota bacterium]
MKLAIAFLAAVLTASSSLGQQSNRSDDEVLDSLFAVKSFGQVSISPDGAQVAWTIRDEGAWRRNTDGSGTVTKIAAGNVHGLAWSPDSRSLAYLAGKAHRQLFVSRAGREPLQLTTVAGYLAEPAWSPNGRSIAFLFIENARREAGATVAMTRDTGVISEHIDEQRVAVVDVGTKNLRVLSPADTYVYHFDWSPDAKHIVAEAAPGSGDNNYWIAQLHVIDVSSATMKPIYQPKLQLAEPHWSPDGAHIAFLEGLMSDEGSNGGDIMVINADGSSPHNITDGMKITPTAIRWSGNGDLTFLATIEGDTAVGRFAALVDQVEGPVTPTMIWRGAESISGGDEGSLFSRDGRAGAVIHSSFTQPPEIFAGAVGQWKPLTKVNASMKAMTGEAKSIRWKSDAFEAQGWLLFPRHFAPGRKYPMVTVIHGGPSSAATARWPGEQTIMLARGGFFVFMPNPRGSYGQGESFTQANVKDFGYGDLRDVLRGIDAVEAAYPIDDTRLGIYGWSYGGFMTMWTVTQTDRFRAAVAGAGIANWQSYYGENDITQWMIPFFGASVYDDPAVYAKSSPITFIKNVKTPTLVEVGERDGECPAPQSYEFWRALKAMGVETQLVIYPDEGHHFEKPEHKRDVTRRAVAWFVTHLR